MNKPVSVIMPCHLGYYPNCADDREEKFIRAVNSFLSNDYDNKQLVIVADGCKMTEAILENNYRKELALSIIRLVKTRKRRLFSGKLRSLGIKSASGILIMYLDSDDMYGEKHISMVAQNMFNRDLDWCYFNDFIKTPEGLIVKEVELEHGSIGTSSIAHKKTKGLDWRKCNGYGHDWTFVKKLMKWSHKCEKIYGATYIICHIPKHTDN